MNEPGKLPAPPAPPAATELDITRLWLPAAGGLRFYFRGEPLSLDARWILPLTRATTLVYFPQVQALGVARDERFPTFHHLPLDLVFRWVGRDLHQLFGADVEPQALRAWIAAICEYPLGTPEQPAIPDAIKHDTRWL